MREWFSWLRRHGEQVPEPGEIELEVAEMLRVDYNPVEAGKPEPLFWSEIQPITPADLARTLSSTSPWDKRSAGASGKGRSGKVGEAESYLFDAAELVEFAVKWLERMFGGR